MKVGNTKAKTAYENLGQLCALFSSVRFRCFLIDFKNHKQSRASFKIKKITKIKIEIIFSFKHRNIGIGYICFIF